MSRIQQIDPAQATGQAKELLDAVQKKMGMVPNMVAAMASSPAFLEGYLGLSGAVGKNSLSPKLRERIALAVGELNSCDYCLSAHTLIGGKLGLAESEVLAARRAEADEPFDAAVLALAKALVLQRGDLRDEDLRAARDAGLDDGQIADVLGTVVLNTMTNWFNHVARTAIDFPEVKAGAAAAS